jgi:hypothetical protein
VRVWPDRQTVVTAALNNPHLIKCTRLFETVWSTKDTSLVRGSSDFNWPVFCAVHIARFLNSTAIKQTQVLRVSLVSVERLTLLLSLCL